MSTMAQIREVYRLELKGPYRIGCPTIPRERTTREQRRDAIVRAAATLHVREFLSKKRSPSRST